MLGEKDPKTPMSGMEPEPLKSDDIFGELGERMEQLNLLHSKAQPVPQDQLAIALLLDNVEQINMLIREHPAILEDDPDFWKNVFHNSITTGKPRLVVLSLQYLDGESIINECFGSPSVPPIIAATRTRATTHPHIVDTLLSEPGIDIFVSDGTFTLFQRAILNQDTHLLSSLIEAGVAVELDHLFFAISMGAKDSYSYLAARFKGVLSELHNGETLLHKIIRLPSLKGSVELASDIVKTKPGIIEVACSRGHTPFLTAVEFGNVALVEHLIELGANIESVNSSGGDAFWVLVNSPLACRTTEIAEVLLSHGLSPSAVIPGTRETALTRLVQLNRARPEITYYAQLLELLE